MLKKICITLFAGLMLAGCSAHEVTQNEIAVQHDIDSAKNSCYNMLAQRDLALTKMLTNVPKEQVALVLVLTQMQENNKQMMAIATGHSADPCGGQTNVFDAQIAEVQAKNSALRSIGGNVVTLGQWGLGAWTINKAIDGMGDHINGNVTNNNIDGQNNTLNHDSFKTASQNDIKGDGNSLTGGDINNHTTDCPDGDCGGEEGTEGDVGTQGTGDEASTGLLQCIQNPPAGYRSSDSIPLYTPSCSCKSHFAGKC